jgi:predicted RNase H-like HicB family nuclease
VVLPPYGSHISGTKTREQGNSQRNPEQYFETGRGRSSAVKEQNKMMKVVAIIEKGNDGLYSVYSDAHLQNHYFGGFGDSVEEAREDFVESIREAIEATGAESFEHIDIEYHYDIPSLFNHFVFFNVSKFARFAGINESKMRAYKSGASFPGEKTMKKIAEALSRISDDINAVSLR